MGIGRIRKMGNCTMEDKIRDVIEYIKEKSLFNQVCLNYDDIDDRALDELFDLVYRTGRVCR